MRASPEQKSESHQHWYARTQKFRPTTRRVSASLTLIPGTYEVDFENPGFATLKRQNIQVTVQTSVRIDGKCQQIGNVNETISVDTTTPSPGTQPGALGQLIEGKQVQEMPSTGETFLIFLFWRLASSLKDRPAVILQAISRVGPFTNNTGFR